MSLSFAKNKEFFRKRLFSSLSQSAEQSKKKTSQLRDSKP
jgi:hypothetical protein